MEPRHFEGCWVWFGFFLQISLGKLWSNQEKLSSPLFPGRSLIVSYNHLYAQKEQSSEEFSSSRTTSEGQVVEMNNAVSNF